MRESPTEPAGRITDQNSAPRQITAVTVIPRQHRHRLAPPRLGLHPHPPQRQPQRRPAGIELMTGDLHPGRVPQAAPRLPPFVGLVEDRRALLPLFTHSRYTSPPRG